MSSALRAVDGADAAQMRRQLAQLYGQANYTMPELKFKSKPMEGPQPLMLGLSSRPRASDPRRSKPAGATAALLSDSIREDVMRPAAPVPVPAIESGRHIRSRSAIEARAAAESVGADLPQMPIRRGRNTEAEKRKLALLFTLKGGLALPEAGMPESLEGEVPLSLLMGRARSQAPRPAATGTLFQELQRTYADLSRGLEETREYWDETARLSGGSLGPVQAREAAEEEARRMDELKALVAQMREAGR
jgi:hypothetical protein